MLRIRSYPIAFRPALTATTMFILTLFVSLPIRAQTFTVLHAFTSVPDGANPNPVIRDSHGNLFGTTEWGGTVCGADGYTCGTVFEIDSSGNETVLHRFAGGADGANPVAALVEDAMGNLYGTTQGNGAIAAVSTVFKLAPNGQETVLYTFDGPAGCCADAALVLDAAGHLYGTSPYAGESGCGRNRLGCGTIYEITASSISRIRVLHNFDGSDGELPSGSLVRDSEGNLYGTTVAGGDLACVGTYNGNVYAGCGTVYKLAPNGTLTVLHAFTGQADGSTPLGVIQDSAGNLYGIAQVGGDLNCYAPQGCGTIFKVSVNGSFSVLYTFPPTVTRNPAYASLLLRDSEGNLYGAKQADGAHAAGMLFKLDINGNFSDLFDFPVYGGPDGARALGITMDTAGNFYGDMELSGRFPPACPEGCGTVFKLLP